MVALAELISLQLRDRAAGREINRQADELADANRRLRDLALTGDLAGRMGGDEFVVILPDTDETGAAALAERVQRQLGTSDDATFGPVSISAGVACSAGEQRPEAVLVAADQALYAAKGAGRGRVRVT